MARRSIEAHRLPQRSDSTVRGMIRWVAAAGITLGLGLMPGCTSNKNSPEAGSAASEDAGGNKPRAGEEPRENRGSDKSASARPASGRPTIDGIPLDVWFDDPIAVSQAAGPSGTAASAAGETGPKTGSTDVPQPMPVPTSDPPSAAAGADPENWEALISAEAIDAEQKAIRNRIRDFLQSVSRYNAHYKEEIRADAATLAALGGIAGEHPGRLTWKENSKYVRDLASDLYAQSNGLGAKPYEATKKVFVTIDELLSGDKPAGLPEAAGKVPFSEVASRSGLMKRMQTGQDWLKANTTSEALFKKNAEQAKHEAALLAALIRVVATPGYEAADEDEYLDYARQCRSANLDMVRTAGEQDYNGFLDAFNRSLKACNDCHGAGYRN